MHLRFQEDKEELASPKTTSRSVDQSADLSADSQGGEAEADLNLSRI